MTDLHTTVSPDDPVAAFDRLYVRHAPSLSRQTFLLSGRSDFADRAVVRAFRHAWDHWPEVAARPDPGGWVRTAAYDHALSPWHRLSPGHRRRTAAVSGPLLTALQALPPRHRRVLVLHEIVGLDLLRTAREAEATTGAAYARLAHARRLLGERLPEFGAAPAGERGRVLKALALDAVAGHTPAGPPPERVRVSGERATLRLTLAGYGVTAATAAGLAAAALLG
ncbi:sigma factor-like helix-turn-helix DNA-binding protein [Streptomyces sp. RFCAC02]|uniref:RNA polymerase sigma factor n=1 Tax=Streptomyces sp. RFCAC02 TaxID=2499143 RepID=UPI0010223BEC|nr:sigma factor-like helix-turn-helix DNA-binding protein [Streptomyces sp. RFCAC02]